MNEKIGNRRMCQILLTDQTKMNSKSNPEIGKLAQYIDVAIAQGKKLNQNIECFKDNLTSNIASIIEDIIHEEESI